MDPSLNEPLNRPRRARIEPLEPDPASSGSMVGRRRTSYITTLPESGYTYVFVFALPSVTTEEEEEAFQQRVHKEYGMKDYAGLLQSTIINEHLKRQSSVQCENTLTSLRNATIELFESFFNTLGKEEGIDVFQFTSVDCDELFLCVGMSEALAEKLADMGEYPLQLSVKALEDEMINVKITNKEGVVPTYAKYDAKHKRLLKIYPKAENSRDSILRDADRIRLLYDKVTENLDLGELTRLGLLLHHYPAHKRKHLEYFEKTFTSCTLVFSSKLPIEDIRDYFGEQIAFYFLFLQLLIRAFVVMSIVAVPCTCVLIMGLHQSVNADTEEERAAGLYTSDKMKMYFTFFNILWFTVFLKLWKRTQCYYANRWGTDIVNVGNNVREQVNPNFRGERRPNPLDENETQLLADPLLEKLGYLKSAAVTIVFIGLVLLGIAVNQYFTAFNKTWAKYGPIVLSVQIKVWDFIWDGIAEKLTHGEQHVYQPSWDQWKAIKVFLMKLINTFTAFVWITYFQANLHDDEDPSKLRLPCGPKQTSDECVGLLQYNLGLTFVTYVTFGGLDMLLPWLWMKGTIWWEAREMRKKGETPRELGLLEAEAKMLPYTGDDASADYFQIIFPLAFITLYGPVLPITSVLCLFAITTQMRADAWKICKAYRRCHPVRAKGIGIWNFTLEGFNYLSIFNCIGLLLTQIKDLDEFFPGINSHKVTVFFVLQNIFVAFKLIYESLVPDVPARTQLEMNRQALQRMRLFEAEDNEFTEDIVLTTVGDDTMSRYDLTPPLEKDHPAFVKAML